MAKISFERQEKTLIIRERGVAWKFSGLEADRSIGESMGDDYKSLTDRVAVRLVLAQAKSLGFKGERKSVKVN